jgi:hypothetical protein
MKALRSSTTGHCNRRGTPSRGTASSRGRIVLWTNKRSEPATLQELVDAGHGSENTVREMLNVLVDGGTLEKNEGGGKGHPSTWTMLPLS